MNKPIKMILATAVLGLCASAQAATLVQYQFTNSHSGLASYDPDFRDPDTLAANVTADAVNNIGSGNIVGPTSSNTSGIQGGGNPFPNSLFINSGHSSVGYFTDPASAVAGNNYFQFTATPDSGYALNLSDLSFDAAKGGASNPRGWVFRTSVDGFASDVDAQAIATLRPTTTHYTVSLAAAIFQGLTSATTFRVYNYAPTGTNVGSFYDNLTLAGTVSAVPIPAAIWLFGSALAGFGALRRRQVAG